ncbi:MAG: hypothetical protein LUQ59_12045 [Methanothrix sp.]|nr:hypothetical protein [Methanothrix sp.]
MAQLLFFVTVICLARPLVAGSTFSDVYPKAHTLTQSPPELSSLSILCREKKSGGPHITFVGGPDKKALLVVYTDKQVKDLSNIITLKPVFIKHPGESLSSPSARVNPDATLDWAYVYDRNGDGRVDYMAFFYAVLPVKPDDFPKDYPKGGKMTSFEQYKLFIMQSRLVFSHYSDENLDGSTDVVVAAITDPDRPAWVDQFGVLRSTKFNGEVDETWTFKKDISQRIGTVSQKDGKYVVQNGLSTPLQSGRELFDFGTRTMKTINDHGEKCGLTKKSFLQE